MPPEEKLTHTDIWMAITSLIEQVKFLNETMRNRDDSVVSIKRDVDKLYDRVRDVESQKEQVKSITDLEKRLRSVEGLRSQMILLGALAIFLIPILNSWMGPRLSFLAPTTQQEAGHELP